MIDFSRLEAAPTVRYCISQLRMSPSFSLANVGQPTAAAKFPGRSDLKLPAFEVFWEAL
jgi:hypothetical protein